MIVITHDVGVAKTGNRRLTQTLVALYVAKFDQKGPTFEKIHRGKVPSIEMV
jgi:hypothetical protein